MIEAEEERHEHEEDQCLYRIIRCAWKFDDGRQCAAQMQAKDRDEHRDYHLSLQGISTYVVAGTYVYTVPKKTTRLKVQLWGGGGGGGNFVGRKGGVGGGGAFVESIISVEPFDVLEVVVGGGGSRGLRGTEIQIKRKEFEVIGGVIRAGAGADDIEVIDATNGISLGGEPGQHIYLSCIVASVLHMCRCICYSFIFSCSCFSPYVYICARFTFTFVLFFMASSFFLYMPAL